MVVRMTSHWDSDRKGTRFAGTWRQSTSAELNKTIDMANAAEAWRTTAKRRSNELWGSRSQIFQIWAFGYLGIWVLGKRSIVECSMIVEFSSADVAHSHVPELLRDHLTPEQWLAIQERLGNLDTDARRLAYVLECAVCLLLVFPCIFCFHSRIERSMVPRRKRR